MGVIFSPPLIINSPKGVRNCRFCLLIQNVLSTMKTQTFTNSGNEAECSGAKMASIQSVQASVRGISIPISLLGVVSKQKIANMRQKKRKMFARQQEILAHCAMEGML